MAAHLASLMFVALVLVLMSGVPVVFGLTACGLGFALLGIYCGVMPAALLQAMPLRLIGIMKNEMLPAIPFFTLMGLILDRCGLAGDLLETIGQVFGPVRGGLAIAPPACCACSSAASACAAMPVSAAKVATRAPGCASRSAAAARSRLPASRDTRLRLAPSARKACAQARPMPLLPPVINTCLALSCRSIEASGTGSVREGVDWNTDLQGACSGADG